MRQSVNAREIRSTVYIGQVRIKVKKVELRDEFCEERWREAILEAAALTGVTQKEDCSTRNARAV